MDTGTFVSCIFEGVISESDVSRFNITADYSSRIGRGYMETSRLEETIVSIPCTRAMILVCFLIIVLVSGMRSTASLVTVSSA